MRPSSFHTPNSGVFLHHSLCAISPLFPFRKYCQHLFHPASIPALLVFPDQLIEVVFPLGLQALAAWMHARGLKLGVYSDRGPNDFSGTGLGMKGHEVIDAQWMADQVGAGISWCQLVSAGISWCQLVSAGGSRHDQNYNQCVRTATGTGPRDDG